MTRLSKPLLYILATGFLLRLIFFVLIFGTQGEAAFLVSDSTGFLNIAQNLLLGNGFSQSLKPPFSPSAYFPPLYPLFLAGSLAISSSVLPLIMLQMLLSGAMPAIVWLLARRFTKRTDVPYIAAGLMALEPVVGILGLLVLTDTIAVFFLLLASLFFLRIFQDNFQIRDSLLAGIFLALSTLTKPNAQLIFLILAAALFVAWIKKYLHGKAVAVFLVAFFLVLSPWVIRNYIQFGSPSVSATGLRNLYTDFAVSVLSFETGRPYGEIEDELKKSFIERRGIGYSEIQENPALGGELAREGLEIIISHPRSSMMVMGITLQAFFTQDLYAYFSQKFHLIPPMTFEFSPSVVLIKEGPLVLASRVWGLLGIYVFIPVVGRIVWVLLSVFAIAGASSAFRSGGRERIVALFMAAIILYYAATSAVAAFSDQGRHRYPADAFIMILAAYGVSELKQRLKQGIHA